MADVFTPEKRSEVMSRIRGRDTKPELALRSMLHRLGYRFTVHGPENAITSSGNPIPGSSFSDKARASA